MSPPLPLGMPAQLAELQVGDVIVEVENTDVTKASGDLVVSIIKSVPPAFSHPAYLSLRVTSA